MKTIKKIITAILITAIIITLTDCKNVLIKTDKPLYDVLTSHAWENDRESDRFYHFLPDSVCYENHDAENDSTHFENTKHFPDWRFEVKWWLEYNNNRTLFHIKEIETHYDTLPDYDEIRVDTFVYTNKFVYSVAKYNQHKIKTYLLITPEGPYPDSVKVIFKALN